MKAWQAGFQDSHISWVAAAQIISAGIPGEIAESLASTVGPEDIMLTLALISLLQLANNRT